MLMFPPYFMQNALPLSSVVNLGTEISPSDLNILHDFPVDDYEPLVVLLPRNEGNIDDVPMEEIDEIEMEEEEEAMDETESKVEVVKVTPDTGIMQGRKRTKSSTTVQTTPVPGTKKTKGKADVSASLKARNAYNYHFYSKEADTE